MLFLLGVVGGRGVQFRCGGVVYGLVFFSCLDLKAFVVTLLVVLCSNVSLCI